MDSPTPSLPTGAVAAVADTLTSALQYAGQLDAEKNTPEQHSAAYAATVAALRARIAEIDAMTDPVARNLAVQQMLAQ